MLLTQPAPLTERNRPAGKSDDLLNHVRAAVVALDLFNLFRGLFGNIGWGTEGAQETGAIGR
jgi:hypothetical protein